MKKHIHCNKRKYILFIFIFFSLDSIAQIIDYTLIHFRKANKWGYVNTSKTIIIKTQYDDAKWFSEGMAAIKVGNKWGYINSAGKMVIPAKYTVAKAFKKGYTPLKNKIEGDTILFAGVSINESGYEICINSKGVTLYKCPAISENTMGSNDGPMETIVKEKVYSIENKDGLFEKIIDDYKIDGNEETFYIAQKAKLYGVFNSKFETIVPFEYNNIKQIKSEGRVYLHVQKNEMNGIMNADGAFAILPEYYYLTVQKGIDNKNFVIVQKNGKTFVKNLNNVDIITQGFTDIKYEQNGGFIIKDTNNLYGFYMPNATMINPKYAALKSVEKGSEYLEVTTTAGKIGYINTSGMEFFEE